MYEHEGFVEKYITKRSGSMFMQDVLDNEDRLHEGINGKSVLVIGGAGSIGSAFTESVLHYQPSELFVIDTNENALVEMTRWLRSDTIKIPKVYCSYPMDYSSDVFRKMFIKHGRFDIIANFSAHKHVRSEKDIYSIEAMLHNNVINARGFLELLMEYKPDTYFCVSTDKAANPVNVMGASKRIMEDMIFSYSDSFNVKTARFANVAFSNGSLLDGFVRRMESLQPLSAPSDVRRYFVSQREAGHICMLATVVADNREILFPKLDNEQMMKFDVIAEELLKAKGYTPYICDSENAAIEAAKNLRFGGKEYPVYFSKADTSGEKMYEEFYTDTDSMDMDRFQSLGVIYDVKKTDRGDIFRFLEKLEEVLDDKNVSKEQIVKVVKDYLPNFEHIETGKSLDTKM